MSVSLDPNDYTPEQIREIKSGNERRVREAARRGDVHIDGMPLKVTLELTADCNFFCRMCEFPAPRESGRKKGYELTAPVEKFNETIVPNVFPFALVVNLTVVGEPLMVPYLDRVLEIAEVSQTKLEFITHGQFLDEAMIEKIGPHAAGIVVSFDGGTRETFNRIRVGGDFNVITRNMLAFQRWREKIPEGGWRPYFHMNATLMRENIHELPAMVQLAHELGVDKLNGALMIAFSPKMAKSSLLNARALANEAFARGRAVAEELGQYAEFPAPFPNVSEEEAAAVEFPSVDLPDGPLPHLKDALAGGPLPDLKIQAAKPEESLHELGANIPDPDAEGNISFVPIDEIDGTSQMDAAAATQVVEGQDEFSKERAFGSPLQQSPDERREQAQARMAMSDGLGTDAQASSGADHPGYGVAAEPNEEEGRYTCKFLWNEVFISLTGDVAPCCIQGRPIVGNINDQDLASIWNGPAMKEMRERLLTGDPIPCCKDCNYNTQLGKGEYREDTLIIPERIQRRKQL
ncbi:MAG: SPASM domain-containing protein [Planctomycetes bacterium]|nr:SPASM domain-containing protein [Planctomycetota bacterium]